MFDKAYFFNYKTQFSKQKYKFLIVCKDNNWKSYIMRLPKTKHLNMDPIITHVVFDSKMRKHFISWSFEVKSKNEMESISAYWAELLQRYIDNGVRFDGLSRYERKKIKKFVPNQNEQDYTRMNLVFFHKKYEKLFHGGFVSNEIELMDLASLVWNNIDRKTIEWIKHNNLVNKVMYCIPKPVDNLKATEPEYSVIYLPGFSCLNGLYIPYDGYSYEFQTIIAINNKSRDYIKKYEIREDPDMVIFLSNYLGDRVSLHKRRKEKR